MRLFRYFLIMVVGAAIGAGAWVAWQSITKESPSASFLERLRLPQYKPDGSTRGDELLIGQGYQLPYVSLSWDIHPSSASETSHDNDWPHTHVRLNLVDTELDVDMGGQRTAIEVDGVQGWFTVSDRMTWKTETRLANNGWNGDLNAASILTSKVIAG